ncbi:HlyD family secretion protein [Pseudoduganella danionis]|nr:HlyD family efflux transporter periplasmic adaptor subunit [Pseudoduganella danionis]
MKTLPATFLPSTLASLLLAGLLTGCTQQTPAYWSGYAEGEYVYVSSPLAGRVEAVAVLAGQNVAKDSPLFSIDAESEQIAQQEAAARLNSARAQASNLNTGKRRDELAVTRAQLAQARAAEALASHDLQRQQQLAAQGFVSKARAEDAATTLSQSRARVAELAAAVQVAQLPGRQDERTAQRAAAQAAQEVLKQSQWRTRQKQQSAMQAALVAEVYYRVGEYVQAGQPVLSLLPPANIKARFFVPEQDVGTLHAGQAVTISCDGCGAAIPAQISRIATQPEFTPPVIYSNGQRSKLVFMVEARPQLKDATRLKPGQPLDVRLAATTSVQGN